jgi:hypothetical protein
MIYRTFALTLLTAISGLLVSCATHVRIDGAVPSPDGKLELGVVARSESNKSFTDPGSKDVYVSVRERGTEPAKYLYQKRVAISAASLDWHVEWLSSDSVVVTFTDQTASPKRTLREIHLKRNSADSFIE